MNVEKQLFDHLPEDVAHPFKLQVGQTILAHDYWLPPIIHHQTGHLSYTVERSPSTLQCCQTGQLQDLGVTPAWMTGPKCSEQPMTLSPATQVENNSNTTVLESALVEQPWGLSQHDRGF